MGLVLWAWSVMNGSFMNRVGFTYRLYGLKPGASRSKGASKKLWYACGQLPAYDHLD